MDAVAMTASARTALVLAVVLAVTIAWEVAVRAAHAQGAVPLPSGIVRAGIVLTADGTLARALGSSLQRVLIGFSIAALIGIPLGLAVGTVPILDRTVRPVLDGLRGVAPIAWIPMAILWLGIRGDAALFVVAYAAVFPFIVNTSEAARRIPRSLVQAAESLGASRTLVVRSVILPDALPFVFTGARIAMAFAWGSIIAAELAIGIKVSTARRSVAGIGQLMVDTLYVRRDVDALVLYMLVIGIVSFLIDAGLRRAQQRWMPWMP
jgi:ABC-type nitrate/sulfonate/bicarbonate transport system permease component